MSDAAPALFDVKVAFCKQAPQGTFQFQAGGEDGRCPFCKAKTIGEHVAEREAAVRAVSGKPRREFLTGLLATWLAGAGKPTREHTRRAEKAAQAALDVLYEPEP